MTYEEAMQALESFGTAQNRKVYKKHGVSNELFGVSYANLSALKKKLKKQHALALELWQSQNHDAMILATMIADPKLLTEEQVERWLPDVNNYVVADAFSGLIAKTSMAHAKMEAWTKAREEFVGQVGWSLLASIALKDKTLAESYFDSYLKSIQSTIHEQKNRVKHSMNQALIAIGVRSAELEQQALLVAKAIGKVSVDHGETGCKTPDARMYIKKTLDRKGHVIAA